MAISKTNSAMSFFRLDPGSGQISYDKTKKMFPLSQDQKCPDNIKNLSKQPVCIKCKRSFKKPRGLQHLRPCKETQTAISKTTEKAYYKHIYH